MITLDPQVTAALQGNDIWTVRLVKFVVGFTTYLISDHYKELSIGTDVYLPNGNLLSIDNIKNSVEADQDTIDLGLSAIDSTFRQDILAADAIGGRVTIYRGLLNTSTGLLIDDPITVFEGIIYSVGINEEVPSEPVSSGQSTLTANVEVRSLTYRLSETNGRLTNDASQRRINGDESMSFVAGLNGVNVKFGGT